MLINYNEYQFNKKEYLQYIFQGIGISIIIGYLFYQSVIGILILLPILYPYLKMKKENKKEARKWRLNQEFLDGMISLSAALNAGYSVEHSFEEALRDLSSLYDKDSFIIREFTYIRNQIKMNITVEQTLIQFGERTGIDDIISFAEVFSNAKRTGGDLNQIIRSTCNTIRDRVDVKREIMTVISGKKLEACIMKFMPLGFLCFLLICSPGFLDPLYHNALGIILMTVLLIAYLFTYQWIDKIVDIEV